MNGNEISLIEFLWYYVQSFPERLIPVAGSFIVFLVAVYYAISRKKFPAGIRILSVAGTFLLFLAISLEMAQPVLQLFLEEELDIIFLEADKVTGTLRNLRYLLFPVGVFMLGISFFDDRFEDGEA